MKVELHVAFYFQNFENHSFSFNKTEKMLDVANDEINKHATSQSEILSILGYTKMINVWT
jgi:hypothetical protein